MTDHDQLGDRDLTSDEHDSFDIAACGARAPHGLL